MVSRNIICSEFQYQRKHNTKCCFKNSSVWPGNVSDINIEINCYCISSQALEMTLKRIILFDKQIRPWFSIGAVNRWKWFCCFLLGQLRCIGIHLFLRLKNIWSINKHEQQYNSRSKKWCVGLFWGKYHF